MNFIIPENATREEVEAVTKAGMDAMMSGEKDVAFLHWGSPEHKEHLEQEEEKKKRDDEANQKMMKTKAASRSNCLWYVTSVREILVFL